MTRTLVPVLALGAAALVAAGCGSSNKSSSNTCDGDCAKAWPPVTTGGKPVAEEGADASKLGTTSRSDGKTQVTYGGHPLYYYAEDAKPGDMNGQGSKAFGAEWYVVGPNGSKVEAGGGGKREDTGRSRH